MNRQLLAIDPGKKGLAFAYFFDGVYAAGSVHALSGTLGEQCSEASALASVYTAQEAVVEEMVYYPQQGSAQASSEIAALLRLQAIGAAAAFSCGAQKISFVPARTWKGQVPKAIMQGRIERVLSAEELSRARVCAAQYGARGHNLWDAIGIGLHYLGRL